MEVCKSLNIEAWGICGLFYRPFLNEHFGPPQISSDADVVTRTVAEAIALDAELVKRHPWRRWSVEARAEGFPLGGRSIIIRLGAVRMVSHSGDLEFLFGNQMVMEHLQNGVIGLNGQAVKYYGGEAKLLKSALCRAHRSCHLYLS